MGIKIINIDEIVKKSTLVKEKPNPQYKKLVEEANERIKLNHIEEGKTYIKAMNYIAR